TWESDELPSGLRPRSGGLRGGLRPPGVGRVPRSLCALCGVLRRGVRVDRAAPPPPAAGGPSRGGAAAPLRDRAGPAAGRRAPRGGGAPRALRIVQRRAGGAPSLRLHGARAEGRGLAGALLRGAPSAPRAASRVRLRDRAPAPLPGTRRTALAAREAGGEGGPDARDRGPCGQERARRGR